MLRCPHCGADNNPSKSSCWNCWSPLPILPAASTNSPQISPTNPAGEQPRSARGAVIAIVLLSLVCIGILGWYYASGRPRQPHGVEETARNYLLALSSSDVRTQHQLATEQSKGMTLPSWMVVVTARVHGESLVQGQHARVPIILRLAPGDDRLDGALRAVVSREYQLYLSLEKAPDGWHVDQRALLQALKQALRKDNPQVAIPPWQ